ncbi:efflux RND transporter periplasmic adaptor subunit [Kiritimatiellota bacterium B12222]|nr:efflux RND transporter periplasmic adaptor subunit [Kiritimatiellota bacterium B12222]
MRTSSASMVMGVLSWATVLLAQSEFEGLVEPVRDVLMGPPVAGRVATLYAGEGAVVKKGEKLLVMDDSIEALEVQRRKMVLEDQSDLLAAKYRKDLLKEDLESTRKLFESTASVSRDELARKEVEALLAEVEYNRMEQMERREQAELDIAKARLQQYVLIAPFDGVMAELSVDEGESIQAGQPVLRMVDLSSAFLLLNLPADLAAGLKMDEEVVLVFQLDDEVVKKGKVAFISPVIDPASGLRKVKMFFKNDAPKVEPGRIGLWVREGAAHE